MEAEVLRVRSLESKVKENLKTKGTPGAEREPLNIYQQQALRMPPENSKARPHSLNSTRHNPQKTRASRDRPSSNLAGAGVTPITPAEKAARACESWYNTAERLES